MLFLGLSFVCFGLYPGVSWARTETSQREPKKRNGTGVCLSYRLCSPLSLSLSFSSRYMWLLRVVCNMHVPFFFSFRPWHNGDPKWTRGNGKSSCFIRLFLFFPFALAFWVFGHLGFILGFQTGAPLRGPSHETTSKGPLGDWTWREQGCIGLPVR